MGKVKALFATMVDVVVRALAPLVIGGSIGLFVGFSGSPVVAVLLPLLFGLLGGAAVLLQRQGTAAGETGAGLHLVADAKVPVAILCAASALTALVGGSVRTDQPLDAMLPRWSGAPTVGTTVLQATHHTEARFHDAAWMVRLEVALRELRVGADERGRLLALARQSLEKNLSDFKGATPPTAACRPATRTCDGEASATAKEARAAYMAVTEAIIELEKARDKSKGQQSLLMSAEVGR